MHYGEIEHRSIYGEPRPKAPRNWPRGGSNSPLPVLPDEHNWTRLPTAALLLHPIIIKTRYNQRKFLRVALVVACLKTKNEIAAANRTSTIASVAPVRDAGKRHRARNQIRKRSRPMSLRTATPPGLHDAVRVTCGYNAARDKLQQSPGLKNQANVSVKRRGQHQTRAA